MPNAPNPFDRFDPPNQQNPFDQFDSVNPAEPPAINEHPHITAPSGKDIMILTIILLLAFGAYKLGRKVLTDHAGWIRVAKAVTALSLLPPTGMLIIDAPKHSHYGNSEWAAVLLTVIFINAVFWAVLWVAKGFKGNE